MVEVREKTRLNWRLQLLEARPGSCRSNRCLHGERHALGTFAPGSQASRWWPALSLSLGRFFEVLTQSGCHLRLPSPRRDHHVHQKARSLKLSMSRWEIGRHKKHEVKGKHPTIMSQEGIHHTTTARTECLPQTPASLEIKDRSLLSCNCLCPFSAACP